jgi:hypothetical protein
MDHLRKRLRGLEVAPVQARAEARHDAPLYCLETGVPLVELH